MHVVLVGAELEENLATRYLAASLERAGHTADVAAFSQPSDAATVVRRVRDTAPGLVGMSMTFQRRAKEFGALADDLRAAGFGGHVTVGGHFPTFAYRTILDRYASIDSAVRHEGEATLPELCDAVEAGAGPARLGEIQGIAHRDADGAVRATPARPLCPDLDLLPFPKRVGDPQVHLGIPTAFLVGSRGCYGSCTFCCIKAFVRESRGPVFRERSVGNLADEIAELRFGRGVRLFVFHDDDFFTRDRARDRARMTALRDALRSRDVRDVAFVVKARPDDVHPDVFSVLQEIGLLRVYVGIEAGSSQGLATLGRGIDVEANLRALVFLRKRDLYSCFNMLLFDPDSTVESLRASLGFLRKCTDVPMNFCRTEIYVGTPLEKRLAREGRLRGDEFGWDYEISDPQAERAFRVFSRAFRDRNFRCDGLMNSNLGLGYHLQLVRHFYPQALTSALERRAIETIRRVNLDGIERMEAILDFAASAASGNDDARAEFTERTCRDVSAANELLEREVRDASRALVEASRIARTRPAQRRRWAVAAAIALAPFACTATKGCSGSTQPPVDPVPPPHGGKPHPGEPKPPRDAGPDASVVVDPLPPPPDPLPPPHDPIPSPIDRVPEPDDDGDTLLGDPPPPPPRRR